MTETTDRTTGLRLGPRSTERPSDVGSTLVAGLEGIAPARVDGGGLVTPWGAEWSVDWWIGADDRWHLPAREASVRQRRIGHGPIIETALRVPSGDVLHTVYPVVVAGGTATVIEIRNESPVPVALAVALRPYPVHSPAGRWPVGASRSRPAPTLDSSMVLFGSETAIVLPRKPNEAGSSAAVDLLDEVRAGKTLTWSRSSPTADTNAVCLYPLPHRTSLRFAVPGPGTGPFSVDALPDAEAVARGWTAVVDRSSRHQFPDSGISALAGAARARLLLEATDLPDAVVSGAVDAGPILEGLAVGGHRAECRSAVQSFARSFPYAVTLPSAGGSLARGIGLAVELLADEQLTESVLDPLTQLTHLVEKAAGRRPTDDGLLGRSEARLALARIADLAGQHDAARELRSDAARPAGGVERSIDPESIHLAAVSALGERAAPARRWSDTEPPTAATQAEPVQPVDWADDPGAAARFWLAARRLLLREVRSDDGAREVELLPEFPTAWRGGTVEVHDAPVAGRSVSFAIRWHGYRPALLWEMTQPGPTAVRLRCPGLDPAWGTTEATGEALLAGSVDELPGPPAPGDSFG